MYTFNLSTSYVFQSCFRQNFGGVVSTKYDANTFLVTGKHTDDIIKLEEVIWFALNENYRCTFGCSTCSSSSFRDTGTILIPNI